MGDYFKHTLIFLTILKDLLKITLSNTFRKANNYIAREKSRLK